MGAHRACRGRVLTRRAGPLPAHARRLPRARRGPDRHVPSLHHPEVAARPGRHRLGAFSGPFRALLRPGGAGARRPDRVRLHAQRTARPGLERLVARDQPSRPHRRPRRRAASGRQPPRYEDGASPGTSSLELESRVNDWFFELAREDDFIGVQTYTRFRYGPEGPRSPGHDWSDAMRELTETDQTTQMGYEYYPQALGGAIRRAHRACPGVPVLVTENGIATANDEKRTAYIHTAMREVLACLAEGIEVRSYLYWSLLDNYEWAFGYAPTFGLVAVDRQTFARHPRPSASWLGAVARAGALSGAAQSVWGRRATRLNL
ncbi:MAG: glycosyl hydrolase family protein [Chloroflexi bacterium]|nr:MAG: glycosyl hydrolase family protein [Chloroflexota bacterium]